LVSKYRLSEFGKIYIGAALIVSRSPTNSEITYPTIILTAPGPVVPY